MSAGLIIGTSFLIPRLGLSTLFVLLVSGQVIAAMIFGQARSVRRAADDDHAGPDRRGGDDRRGLAADLQIGRARNENSRDIRRGRA
ncbi:MAG: hypothetical protein R3D59_05910 [Paracoccaceae bacterium]